MNLSDVISELEQDPEWHGYKDENGVAPLTRACINGDIDIVKVLLSHGADPNDTCNYNSSALHKTSDIEIIKLLLKHGAKVNIQNNNGDTPLIVICDYYGDEEIVKLLLEHGAKVNIQNKNGETATDKAFGNEFTEIVEVLRKAN